MRTVAANPLTRRGAAAASRRPAIVPLSSAADRRRRGTFPARPPRTVAATAGYDCVICMAEPFSVERRRLMRMLGAKVIVTPKAGKGTGMVRKAEELCAKNGWFLCHQFENEANWKSPRRAGIDRRRDADSPRRRVAAATRLRRGCSVEMSLCVVFSKLWRNLGP